MTSTAYLSVKELFGMLMNKLMSVNSILWIEGYRKQCEWKDLRSGMIFHTTQFQ